MKIKELGKTTFCTEKCNGVVLGAINKNSYKKVVILSNRDKKLLDRLTELKAEICKGNRCQTCALYQTVLCSRGFGGLNKVPQSITVYEKEMEPPKPVYSAPEKVKTKEVNRVAYCLKNLVTECSLANGSCAKCQCNTFCPMYYMRGDSCVAQWMVPAPPIKYLTHAVCRRIKGICGGRLCYKCLFHQPSANLTHDIYHCMLQGKPQDWDDRIFSDRVISSIERGLENDTGRKDDN